MGSNIRVIYYGKPKMYDNREKGTVKMYIAEYALPPSDIGWKKQYVEELEKIMEEYEGIKSIEFFVP